MKKKTIVFLTFLLFGVNATQSLAVSPNVDLTSIIDESLFVNIARDIELLRSWLRDQDYSIESIDTIYYKSYQEILALYEVDQYAFEESSKYYLACSVERALEVYAKIYTALEALLPLA